jgi:hypothetical protein
MNRELVNNVIELISKNYSLIRSFTIHSFIKR